MKPKSGWYWHCHHDILCEYVWNEDERINAIKITKPKNEIKTRLKLFKPIKAKLPKDLVEARQKYFEAGQKLDEARQKYFEAGQKYDEARQKYDEAWQKYNKAWQKYNKARQKYFEIYQSHLPMLTELHAKECGREK